MMRPPAGANSITLPTTRPSCSATSRSAGASESSAARTAASSPAHALGVITCAYSA